MNYRSLPACLAAALLAGAASLPAQTPAPRPPTAETIELSPFEVSTSAVRGYVASETMTGSRVKTPIAELPYSVNVMTSEFLEDFGIYDLLDNVTHISGFTGLDIGGNFNLRGFSSSNQLRDGFFRLGRYGSSNIDRLEVIKGSSAAIYGRTSPGGMINLISKSPRDQANQKLMVNFGDYGTQRGTLEATGPFLPDALGKTRYIFTASHYQRDFDQEYARNRNHEYYLALDHVFADGSKLFFSAEYFLQIRHSAPSAVPLVTDQRGTASTADDVAVGYAVNLGKLNASGPNSELNRGNTGLNAVYDKKLNAVFSTRLSANTYQARRWDYNYVNQWTAFTINPPVATTPIRTARAAVPSRGRIYEDGGGFQGDLLAHYWTNNRQLEHRTLLTLDINDYYRWDPSLNYAAATNPDLVAWNAVRTVTLDRNTLEPVGPIAYFPKWFDSSQTVKTRHQKRRTTVFGGLLRHQTSFLDGRLLTFAGARYDDVRFRDRDFFGFTAPAGYVTGSMIDKKVDFLKPNAGFNFKVTPGFRVFASYSESYFVSQNDTAANHFDPTFKSEVADGWDYGFKGELLNGRLSYTVSGFYANRHNVSVTNNVETPLGSGNFVQVTERDGDQLVRGYEIDVTWRVTDTVAAGGSWGHVYSIYSDFGSAFPAAIGRRVNGISPQNGSVYVKYSPNDGLLKRFSANVGVSYVAATPTEAPNAGDTYATLANGQRVVTRSTNQWRLMVPSFNIWSFGFRYRLPGSGGIDHSLALNINNAFDRDYLRVNRLIGEKRAIFLSYTINRTGARSSR